ncbi:hypothetical protein Scep_028408 [Stephania cephalantha]|uniref:Plastocyanin-like domain-containing protein n=1 Tax=Stephania cephalantha TaxID=152367 RepID=A0AAP0HM21_9MAGN
MAAHSYNGMVDDLEEFIFKGYGESIYYRMGLLLLEDVVPWNAIKAKEGNISLCRPSGLNGRHRFTQRTLGERALEVASETIKSVVMEIDDLQSLLVSVQGGLIGLVATIIGLTSKVVHNPKCILINGRFSGPQIDCVTNDNIIVNVINKLDQPFLNT